MKIEEIGFDDFVDRIRESGEIDEGIVVLGAGEPHEDWIDGIFKIWKDEGIVDKDATLDEVFSDFYLLTTTGGRWDLAMVWNRTAEIHIGIAAMWRLRFGDCSWISDFIPNYWDQYGANEVEI